jgi:uncharacterized protein (UPF0335 family)
VSAEESMAMIEQLRAAGVEDFAGRSKSMAGQGHNSSAELRSLIERVERLEAEKKAIGDDVKDVYLEAKSRGYDVKHMRQMVRERKMTPEARAEHYALEETYRAALAMELLS